MVVNTYIQVAAGVIPAALMFTVLFLSGKRYRIRNLAAAILFTLGFTIGITLFFRSQLTERGLQKGLEPDGPQIVYALAEAGRTDLAGQLLQYLRETRDDSEAYTLCAARLYGMEGNYKAAKTLYEKAITSAGYGTSEIGGKSPKKPAEGTKDNGSAGIDDSGGKMQSAKNTDPNSTDNLSVEDALMQEYEAVAAAADCCQTDWVLLEHFDIDSDFVYPDSSQNPPGISRLSSENPDLTVQNTHASQDYREMPNKKDAVNKTAQKAIQSAVRVLTEKNPVYREAAATLTTAVELYERFLEGNSINVEMAKGQLKLLELVLDKAPELLTVPQFRISRLKLQILCEDYEGIAASIDEGSDYNELLIVSELCINLYVEPSFFQKEFIEPVKEKHYAVELQLETAVSNKSDADKNDVDSLANRQLELLKQARQNPALYCIKERLVNYVNDDLAGDNTKVYLQLAKIENILGNKEISEGYIAESIGSVGNCKDDDYSAPMYEIISIISDRDNPERLKAVAEYVDRILANTMTIKMPEKYSKPNKKAGLKGRSTEKATDKSFESSASTSALAMAPTSASTLAPTSASASASALTPAIFSGACTNLHYENISYTAGFPDIPQESVLSGTAVTANTSSTAFTLLGSNALSSADEPTAPDFRTSLADYVSRKRAAINIVRVNTAEFPQVRAAFNIDDSNSYTENDLASKLELFDCGIDITDFTVGKIDYKRANILLCCDVSGSMGGSAIGHLKDTIGLFVSNSSDKINIALLTFSSGVNDIYGFGTPPEALLSAAQSLRASGGTNIYDAVVESIDQFTIAPDEINCIILLSDGEDNRPRPPADIHANVGKVCAEKGIVLYSMGLGSSVDTAYLDLFSGPTGGSYLHVTDSVTLNTFYEHLRNQILNQYMVEFTAEDTLSISRTLKIAVKDDSLAYDLHPYSLEDEDDMSGFGTEAGEDSPIYMKGKSITGLNPKLLYKGSSEYDVNLLGTGFEEGDIVKVSLKGNLKYDDDKISCEFVDDKTLALKIPAGLACGIYDVHVTINGKKAILDNGLAMVTQGSEKTTVFGPYVFTSYSKVRNEKANTTTLTGFVTMNEWLCFKGDLVLTGNLNDNQIRLEDPRGSYIKYHTGTSEGLAAYYAKNNWSLDLPSLNSLVLYNDKTHAPTSDEYRVQPSALPAVFFTNVFTLSTPGLKLYPDRIVIDNSSFTTDFPFQKKLLKSSGITKLFSFDLDVGCLLTSKNIGIKLDYSSKSDNKTYSPVNFGNMPMYYSPGSFDIKLDTIKGEYYIKYIARVLFIEGDGVGISLKWEKNLVPKEVRIYADIPVNTNVSGIPVTYDNFMIGLADIEIDTHPLKWKLEGSMSVSAAKISAVFPGLNKWLGDVSVLKLEDAKLAFSLGQGYIGVSTDVKLFEKITLAKLLIEAGNFKYSNLLLNMDKENTAGLHAAVTLGVIWKTDNCNLDLSGTVDLAVADKVLGTTVTGTCDIDVKWWILEKNFYAQGITFVGLYKNHKNEAVFLIKTQSHKSDKKLKDINIAWSMKSGKYAGKKDL